jgi:amino acid transporter
MNPTGQPFGFDAQPPNSDARAREEVNVPAILLLVVGGLLAAYSLYGVANNLLGSNQKMIDAFNDNPQLAQYSGLATTMSRFGVVFSLFFLACRASSSGPRCRCVSSRCGRCRSSPRFWR